MTPRKIFDTCHTTSIVVVHRTVIVIMRLCHIHKLHFDAQHTQFHHIHMYMLTTINTYALTPTVVYIHTDMQYGALIHYLPFTQRKCTRYKLTINSRCSCRCKVKTNTVRHHIATSYGDINCSIIR